MKRWVILAAFLLLLPPALLAQSNAPKKVIFSTDLSTGLVGGWRGGFSDIDDGWAVAMALDDRATYDVRAVVVVLGNNNAEPELAVAQKLVQTVMKRPDVPVAKGASVKLTDPQVGTADGTQLVDSCWNDGVELIASTLQKDGPATLVAIGPLTDVACMQINAAGPRMKSYPKALANITNIVAIMGRNPDELFGLTDPWTGKQKTGLSDFNYVMDERAAQVLLQSSLPLTFMTFSLTSSALIERTKVAALKSNPSAVAQFFYANSLPFITSFEGGFGQPGFHPWDQNALHYVGHPEDFVCKQAVYRVVACGSDTYHKSANNPCAGHGPDQPSSLDKEASQLWLSSEVADTKRATACTKYADGGKERFLAAALKFLK